jgi:hypothetical protein
MTTNKVLEIGEYNRAINGRYMAVMGKTYLIECHWSISKTLKIGDYVAIASGKVISKQEPKTNEVLELIKTFGRPKAAATLSQKLFKSGNLSKSDSLKQAWAIVKAV